MKQLISIYLYINATAQKKKERKGERVWERNEKKNGDHIIKTTREKK